MASYVAAWAMFALAGSAAAAPPEALEFKGLALGRELTVQQVREEIPGASCAFVRENRYFACSWETTIADESGRATASALYLGQGSGSGEPGRIETISITTSTQAFDGVVRGLIGKYGKPTSQKNEEIQNAFGAKFKQTTITWRRGTQAVVAMRYSDKTTESIFMFLDDVAALREVIQKENKRAKDL